MHPDARAQKDMQSRQRTQDAIRRIAAKLNMEAPDMSAPRAHDRQTVATLEREQVANLLTAIADHVDPQPQQEGARDMSQPMQPQEQPVTLPANDPLPDGMERPDDAPETNKPDKAPAVSPTVPAPRSTPTPGGTPAPRTPPARSEPEAQPATGRKVVDTGKSGKGKD
jgi:hypothetical protein